MPTQSKLSERAVVSCNTAPYGRHTFFRAALAAMLVAAIGLVSAQSSAEPVTFRFEAEITSINRSPDPTFDLPSNVMIGDDISGQLQFEPFGFGQSVGVSSLEVNLGTEVFSVAGAPLTTQSQIIAIDPPGLYEIRDSIGVGFCPSYGSVIGACVFVKSSSSNDIELARLAIWLSGEITHETSGDGLITHGESLGNVDVWNRLSDRHVFMTFTSSPGSGSIQLEAVIASMFVIPEPSSLMLIVFGIISLTRCGKRDRFAYRRRGQNV